jgi:hypothetical protein
MIVLENADILEGDSTNASETDFTLHGLDNNALKQLADGQLANSKGTIYTADSTDVVSSIILVNTGAAHNHVNLYLKPTGGTSRRLIPKDLKLEPGYSLHFDGAKVMVLNTSGQLISAGGSGADGIDGVNAVVAPVLAGGTVDAITADYTPNISLANFTICSFEATGANTSLTPTFNPDGLGALTIVKNGGQPLAVGDIAGAGAICLLAYNLANTRWELLNPAVSAGGGGIMTVTAQAKYTMPAGTPVFIDPTSGKFCPISGIWRDAPAAGTTTLTPVASFGLCQVDTNTFVVLGNTPCSVMAGTVAANKRWTWGSLVEVYGNTQAKARICKIDTNKFAVVYIGASSYPCARVGTVSGTTITLGAELVLNAYECVALAVGGINTDKFVVAYDASTILNVKACTVATTTITAGNAVATNINGSTFAEPSICKTYTDEFAVAASTEVVEASVCAGTVATRTITLSAKTALTGGSTSQNTILASQGDRRFTCAYVSLVIAGSISGTTITLGTLVASTVTAPNQVVLQSTDVWLICSTSFAQLFTVSSNVVTAGVALNSLVLPNSVVRIADNEYIRLVVSAPSFILDYISTETLKYGYVFAGFLDDDYAADANATAVYEGQITLPADCRIGVWRIQEVPTIGAQYAHIALGLASAALISTVFRQASSRLLIVGTSAT